MTPKEAVQLVRYVRACCPQQQVDEYTYEAWYDLLGNLELSECRDAAASIAQRQPFVAPSEIIREIADSRSISARHSAACRSKECGDCRFSWCGCYCHAKNVKRVVSEPDPHQLGPGHDDPENPWNSIDMFKPPE